MAKKTAFPFVHLIAVLFTPLFFACGHATLEESDGYADSSSDNPALSELTPSEETATEGEAEADASEAVVADAQKQLVKSGAQKKKVTHPFSDPRKQKKVAVVTKPKPAASAMVQAPNQMVVRNGSSLNRYYFLRLGDTPEKLSKLFYGNPDRAAELVEWNGAYATWEPGKVMYYRSGSRPDDERLVSYYFEAGVPTEQTNLGDGESLQALAMRLYGAEGSWREIAVLNAISTGKGKKPGEDTVLKTYPVQLLKEMPTVARMEIPMETEKDAQLASPGIMGFIHHNPLLIACSTVMFLLVSGFLFIQRKRYRSRFDF